MIKIKPGRGASPRLPGPGGEFVGWYWVNTLTGNYALPLLRSSALIYLDKRNPEKFLPALKGVLKTTGESYLKIKICFLKQVIRDKQALIGVQP